MNKFLKIERKWQKKWFSENIFAASDNSKKPKFYNLEMFPYPSGLGLHMGHVRNYTIGDVIARFKRMQGFNVLYPMGFDAFGLPAENAAIKEKIHPKEYTEKAITNFKDSFQRIGCSHDWDRELATCYPDYYKWNQWIFLKMMEKGLAYRKKAPVNWCPSCQTVLANEQVESGRCWRCSSLVEIKQLEQWFLKITEYAEELLQDLTKLDWPDRIKSMQRNWIGKSEGTYAKFAIKDFNQELEIFTTRIDTVFGCTFMVLAPEHPIVTDLVNGTKYEKEATEFVRRIFLEDRFERASEDREKEGVFTGRYAINPFTKEEIPIYIANFVLMDYGTGAIMAVPAHDQRDFEFAQKYKIKTIEVVSKNGNPSKTKALFSDYGILLNSGQFSGTRSSEATKQMTNWLSSQKIGYKAVNYKLRDWLVSRQRYWGTPIPIIHCNKCGLVPVAQTDLPVILPENVKFGEEGNPLKTNKNFLEVDCPKCKGKAERETDTMDTFFDSSWYFLRFCDPHNTKQAFDSKKLKYWMPVEQCIGGAEHAVLHLLYARFFTKVFRDMGFLEFDEPFSSLFNQGVVHKRDLRMSKSKGNVVTQDEIEKKYGIDTARFYLLSIASPGKDIEWDDQDVKGSFRMVKKSLDLLDKPRAKKADKKLRSSLHSTIKNLTDELNNFEHNKALQTLTQFINYLHNLEEVPEEALRELALLLNPFVPHISEEMWEKLGKNDFSSLGSWPRFDEKKINLRYDLEDGFLDTVMSDIREVSKLVKKFDKIRIIVASDWKFELFKEIKKIGRDKELIQKLMEKETNKKNARFVTQIAQKFIRNPGTIPEFIFEQKEELRLLSNSLDIIKSEFKFPIEILLEEKANHQKKERSEPSKPAIVLE